MKMARVRMVLIGLFALVSVAVSVWLWRRSPVTERLQDRVGEAQSRIREVRERPDVVQGEIDATQFNVAAKIAGRILAFHLRKGQLVRPGDLLVELDSPDLQAKRDQARAAQDQAAAIAEKAERGARPEEIDQARGAVERAQVAEDLARLTFERMDRLARDGVVPQQRRDEAETQWKASATATRMAKAALGVVQQGAREEDRAAARAALRRADAALAEVDSFTRELRLLASQPGEVVSLNAEVGELVGPGFPLITFRGDDRHLVLQLREDRLAGLRVGARLRGRVPALDSAELEFEVDFLAAQADFATMRPTSAAGGFDLRTFEVRAKPLDRRADLRPGMTVVIDWARREER